MTSLSFRDPAAARAGGYVLALATLLIAVGLLFHPVPAGGFEERPSVLQNTPWWGPIHVAIAAGFVLCILGTLLMLVAGGSLTRAWTLALAWGAMTVGMVFFTGVALINGWVMHFLVGRGAPATDPVLYDAFNRLLIGYGWLGNPLFLVGLTTLALSECGVPGSDCPAGSRGWAPRPAYSRGGGGSDPPPDSISWSRSSSRISRRFSGSATPDGSSRGPRATRASAAPACDDLHRRSSAPRSPERRRATRRTWW